MPDSQSTSSTGSRRAFFRLRYPVTLHSVLVINAIRYAVVEISEGGLRLVCIASGEFIVQNPINGVLELASGIKCRVAGEVFRMDDGGKLVVLKLTRGPTYQQVLGEQRFVSKAFPDWKSAG